MRPVTEKLMESHNELLLVAGDIAPLDIRSQIIHPSKPAALPASLQA